MRTNLVRATVGAAAAFVVFASAHPAAAASATLVDTLLGGTPATTADDYDGGLNTYGEGTSGVFNSSTAKVGDVIGESNYDILSVTSTRTGNNLQVTVNTGYVNTIGQYGTGLGALFLTPGLVTYNSAADPTQIPSIAPYAYDMANADPTRFKYAVAFDNGQAPTSTTVYQLAGDGSDIQYSYVVGNSPATSTSPGNGPFWFREGQAVDVNPNAGTTNLTGSGITSTFSIDTVNNLLTFNITGIFSVMSDTFTLAWEMTCGNDVVYVSYNVNGGNTGQAPLPATALLMGTVVGAGGLVARWRRRKQPVATA